MKRKLALRNVLITFDISSVAGRHQLAGVLRYLQKKPNWLPRIISRAADFTAETVRNARAEHIDGIIINHTGLPETEAALAASDVPLAVIGIRSEKLDARTLAIVHIRNDNTETGRVAARHFLSLGEFRSFGYIPADDTSAEWSASRGKGFADELAKRGLSVEAFRRTHGIDKEEGRQALTDWLRELPKPAAVFAAWDYPALQALEVCRAEGLRVPKDIAVLGVDNDPMVCDFATPPLSSIPFDFEKEGYESTLALASLIDRPASRAKSLMVTCHPLHVCVRESTARIASPAEGLVKQAMRYIEQHALEGISSHDVAEALGVSQSLLTLRFRERQQTTVSDVLASVRLNKACHLLKSTKKSILEITRLSGFRSVNYLKAAFKKRHGMSMRDYRAAYGTKRRAVSAS